jgi:hypothetical protein
MRTQWKSELDPMADMVAAPMTFLWADERTDDELRSLLAAAENATQTNCWWAVYRAALLIRDEVPRVLAHREGQVPA